MKIPMNRFDVFVSKLSREQFEELQVGLGFLVPVLVEFGAEVSEVRLEDMARAVRMRRKEKR